MIPDHHQHDRLQTLGLVASPRFTVAEAETKTGIPAEAIRRMWRALGLAIAGPDEPVFADEDLETLTVMNTGLAAGEFDLDTLVRVARAAGQTTARMADWQVSTLASTIETHETAARAAATVDIVDRYAEMYEHVLLHSWRRHLGAALQRMAGAEVMDEEDSSSVTATVGFADLVAFSALSNQLDDARIGDLVEIFETRAGDVVAARGGRVIKTLGDSVLFLAEGPVAGLDIGMAILDVIGDDARLPDVHVGIATGPVILRFGDVFGPPVNLAARLTSIARRNRIITDAVTAGALPADRYESRTLTARPVRGFGVVEPVAVRRV